MMKKTLIKMLTTAGFKETSINIFNTLDKNNIHLKDIKYIIETSKKLKNSNQLTRVDPCYPLKIYLYRWKIRLY